MSGSSDACASGRVIAIAGQVASREVVGAGSGFAEELASALDQVVATAASAGVEPSAILHLRIYVTDLDEYVASTRSAG